MAVTQLAHTILTKAGYKPRNKSDYVHSSGHVIRVHATGGFKHFHPSGKVEEGHANELAKHLSTTQHTEEPMTTEIDKGHVSNERARELVESSPNLHPVRSGFVAEPLVQFKEEDTSQHEDVAHVKGKFHNGDLSNSRFADFVKANDGKVHSHNSFSIPKANVDRFHQHVSHHWNHNEHYSMQ